MNPDDLFFNLLPGARPPAQRPLPVDPLIDPELHALETPKPPPKVIPGFPQFGEPARRAPTTPKPLEPIDKAIVGTGATYVLGAIVEVARGSPTAGVHSSNLTGLPFRGGKPLTVVNAPGLFTNLLPAPFGYAGPERFGLSPNYLREPLLGLNRFAGTPAPQSELLRTLPDYDPRVQRELEAQRAREQLTQIQLFTPRLSTEQTVELLRLSLGPQASTYFYNPTAVTDVARQHLAATVGIAEGERLFTVALGDVTPLLTPRAGTQPTAIPSPLAAGELGTIPTDSAPRDPLAPAAGGFTLGFLQALLAANPADP